MSRTSILPANVPARRITAKTYGMATFPATCGVGNVRFSKPIAGTIVVLLAAIASAREDSAATSAADAIVASRVNQAPDKILGPETCSQCHSQELTVWRNTPHFRTFDQLHRLPEAKEIAQRMGIRSIKRGELCLDCHYTTQGDGSSGKLRPIAGISCETCHGAAKEWLAVHSDYGGPTVSKSQESEAHRQARMARSIALGMRNPINPYLVARSCFNCHTVPNERLVNEGGHRVATEDFEFVAWAEGSQRHNFLRSDGQVNAPSSTDRLRVMYVVGLMADLEFSLRATGLATEVKPYGITVAQRAYRTRRKLADIQKSLAHPLVEQALKAAYAVKLKTGNQVALEQAADAVGKAAFDFAETVDGATLTAIDPMLPAPGTYK